MLQEKIKTLSIIGAGISGLSCSYQLIKDKANLNIRIYEKSKGISGRAATRRIDGFTFDHGANYLSTDSLNENQQYIVQKIIESIDIKNERYNIKEQIHLLNGEDQFILSDKKSEKITFPQGINYLGKLINQYNVSHNIFEYNLQKETLITHIQQFEDDQQIRWNVFSGDNLLTCSDQILFSAPAPQVYNIIKNSKFLALYAQLQNELLQSLSQSEYNQQISIALAYKGKISTSILPYYALVNMDRKNDVSWISSEDKKLGHTPDDGSMIIVQMSPDWSQSNWETSQDEIIKHVQARINKIINLPKMELDFYNIQKWKFSLPKKKAIKEDFEQYKNIGLFFTGDSYCDKGRVGVAINAGYETAKEILKQSKL